MDTCQDCQRKIDDKEMRYVIKGTLANGEQVLCGGCKVCCDVCEWFLTKEMCVFRECDTVCKECDETGRVKEEVIMCKYCDKESYDDGMCGDCM